MNNIFFLISLFFVFSNSFTLDGIRSDQHFFGKNMRYVTVDSINGKVNSIVEIKIASKYSPEQMIFDSAKNRFFLLVSNFESSEIGVFNLKSNTTSWSQSSFPMLSYICYVDNLMYGLQYKNNDIFLMQVNYQVGTLQQIASLGSQNYYTRMNGIYFDKITKTFNIFFDFQNFTRRPSPTHTLHFISYEIQTKKVVKNVTLTADNFGYVYRVLNDPVNHVTFAFFQLKSDSSKMQIALFNTKTHAIDPIGTVAVAAKPASFSLNYSKKVIFVNLGGNSGLLTIGYNGRLLHSTTLADSKCLGQRCLIDVVAYEN